MGLIRSLSVRRGRGRVARARCAIGVTEPGCMMGASFVIKARELLDAMPGVVSHDVGLDHAPTGTRPTSTPPTQSGSTPCGRRGWAAR